MKIFVVGAGESLRGFDFSRLRDRETVAVNKVIRDFPDATYWLTADSGIASNVIDWTRDSKAIRVLAYSPTHKRIDKFQKDGRPLIMEVVGWNNGGSYKLK